MLNSFLRFGSRGLAPSESIRGFSFVCMGLVYTGLVFLHHMVLVLVFVSEWALTVVCVAGTSLLAG